MPLIKHLMCGKPQLVWRYLGLLGICGIVNWLTSELISMWWSSEGHTDLYQCSVLVHPLWSWLKCFELTDIRTGIWHTAESNYTLNLYLTQETSTEVTLMLDFVFNTLNPCFHLEISLYSSCVDMEHLVLKKALGFVHLELVISTPFTLRVGFYLTPKYFNYCVVFYRCQRKHFRCKKFITNNNFGITLIKCELRKYFCHYNKTNTRHPKK